MQPTTLKIPPELKARVVSLAADAGKTVHAFLLDTIEQEADRAERRREFIDAALAADAKMKKSGLGTPAKAAHKWLLAVAAGKSPPRPKKAAWRK